MALPAAGRFCPYTPAEGNFRAVVDGRYSPVPVPRPCSSGAPAEGTFRAAVDGRYSPVPRPCNSSGGVVPRDDSAAKVTAAPARPAAAEPGAPLQAFLAARGLGHFAPALAQRQLTSAALLAMSDAALGRVGLSSPTAIARLRG